jgi:methionine salvage enolase-phosphatase E1
MPRPQRKEINFTKDSILSLMQEIYNELVEQRQTAIRIQNKMLSMLKDPNDMMTIGPVIEKQQKIVNDCVEKKISLSKLQSSIWEKSNSNNNESFSLADLDDDLIQNLIDKDVSNDEETYKMKQK